MKATISITANAKEIQEANAKNRELEQKIFTTADTTLKKFLQKELVEVPEVEYKQTQLVFCPQDVEWAFINIEDKIALSIRSEKFVIDYDANVWKAITESMATRNAKPKRFLF